MHKNIRNTFISAIVLLMLSMASSAMANEQLISNAILSQTSSGLSCFAPPSPTWTCDFDQPVMSLKEPACCCTVNPEFAKSCGGSVTLLYACALEAGLVCDSLCQEENITTCLPWPGS